MTEVSDLIKVIEKILDEIDSEKSNLEWGYSWKQSLLKGLEISDALKKKLGYWGDKD